MTTPKPRLTAVERKKRRKIQASIVKGREIAGRFRSLGYKQSARTIDDLANVAELLISGAFYFNH